jgi:hypothetical protein
MVGEPSHVKQLSLNHVCKIGLSVLYSTLLYQPPLRFHYASEDAGIEPRAVATLAIGG